MFSDRDFLRWPEVHHRAHCRWFPQGKVVFIAPTRALVEQQRQSCLQTLCIAEDLVEVMTGQLGKPADRKALWDRKTVIFCTPQVLTLPQLSG